MTCHLAKKYREMSNLVFIADFMNDVVAREVFCHSCGKLETIKMSKKIKSYNLTCLNQQCPIDSIWFANTRE